MNDDFTITLPMPDGTTLTYAREFVEAMTAQERDQFIRQKTWEAWNASSAASSGARNQLEKSHETRN